MQKPSKSQELALQLVANGYFVVPIPKGCKYPKGFPKWEKARLTAETLTKHPEYFFNNGIGILCGTVAAVDLDIYDEKICLLLRDWCLDNIGYAPERVGKYPKNLLVYRREVEKPKEFSPMYSDFMGCRHKIEILGAGQQFVAHAIHPDTGKPYKWKNQSLLDIKLEDLTIIEDKHIEGLFKYFDEIRPKDWEKVSKGKRAGAIDDYDGLYGKTPLDVSDEEIERIILAIPSRNASYERWVNCGMALHHQYEGGRKGFDIWNHWSTDYDGYSEEVCKSKWASFSALNHKNLITLRTLYHEAQEAGALPKKEEIVSRDEGAELLNNFLERFTYVTDGNRVADNNLPAGCSLLKMEEFKNQFASCKVPNFETGKHLKITNLWLEHKHRKTARGEAYYPSGDKEILIDDVLYINTYFAPTFEPTRSIDRLDVFNDHLEYLIPLDIERKWFTDWMAFTLQRPETRCKVTPLHISRHHGTGRGWLVELLELMLGTHNCKKTTMPDLCGEGSGGQFRDYLHQSLLVVIPEVREKNSRYEVSDKIRDILEAKRLEVNLKYGGKKTINIFCNFFFQSNHWDALILPKEDRRIQVITGPNDLKSNDYYVRLYEWLLDSEAIRQLYWWLKRRDISKFNFQRSEPTIGRKRMMANSMNGVDIAIEEFIRQNKYEALQTDQIYACLRGINNQIDFITGTPIETVIGKRFQDVRIVDGKKVHLLGDKDLTDDEIRESVRSFEGF